MIDGGIISGRGGIKLINNKNKWFFFQILRSRGFGVWHSQLCLTWTLREKKLHLNFTWSFVWNSQEIHVKFIWNITWFSHNSNGKTLSREIHVKWFMWILHKISNNSFRQPWLIFSSCVLSRKRDRDRDRHCTCNAYNYIIHI